MGQQQLLLIAIGTILVGIAVLVGLSMLNERYASHKRDVLITEGIGIAAMAQDYYRKLPEMAGGGKSFIGWTVPQTFQPSPNGRYEIESIGSQRLKILGIDNSSHNGVDTLKVRITVTSTDIQSEVVESHHEH